VIITVANRKGGVGKTTTSVFVAHALAAATGAASALIDTDPQRSAVQWAKRAAEAGSPLSLPVLAQPTARLALPDAPNVVIDTPPTDQEIVAAAIAAADVVLVPTSPSALDLSQVQVAVEAARRSGKPVAVLLTRTRRTLSVASAEESLRELGIHVLSTRIPLRESLAMAFGRPVRELHGYDLACAELLGELPEQPYSVAAVTERAAAVPAAQAAQAAQAATPRVPARVIGFDDEELIQRLKSSMARLTARH
jgi:chromosome partitioning protein